MIVFGLLGFYMKRNGYSPAAMVLGMVLGGLMDSNFRRAMSLAGGSVNPLANIFMHWTTIVLIVLIVLSLSSKTPWFKEFIKKISKEK